MSSRGRARAARALAAVAVFLAVAVPGPADALSAQVDDPGYSLQWGLPAIHASRAWDFTDGRGVTIAIVDSGIELGHEDLRSQISAGDNATCLNTGGDPANCTAGGTNDGSDDAGHGTHVAGIAAATTGNGLGVAGVAPGARLMPVRVLQRTCSAPGRCESSGTADDVSAGVRWAVDHGADVVNLSLGGNISQSLVGPAFREAVHYAWSRGVITVVAAGNDIVLPSGFSDEPSLVAAALNKNQEAATYSNGVGNAQWALSAPGGEPDDETSCNGGDPKGIVSTYLGNDYYCQAGTSMAAPFVSGAAALLLSLGLSPQEVVNHLLATAKDLGRQGRDATYGAGALDLENAIESLPFVINPTTTAPATTETTTPASPTTTPATTETPASSTTTTTVLPPDTTPTTSIPEESGQAVDVDATAGSRGGGTGLDGLAITIAALLVLAIGTADAWLLVRGASWARRTPGERAPSRDRPSAERRAPSVPVRGPGG